MGYSEELINRFTLQEEYLGPDKIINRKKPLVSVNVATYQHHNYIKNCLDGILMQRCDFDYEVIIGEDQSTDGTREICIEYAEKFPDKIRLFLRDRKLSQYYEEGRYVTRFNGIWLRMSSRGKYIAICEGDDYWTDPYKLQMQVDFLQKNTEYGLVFTDADCLIEDTNLLIPAYDKTYGRKIPEGDVFELLLYDNPYKTCTSLFRKDLIDQIELAANPRFKMGDLVMWLTIAHKSKVGYIQNSTSVYRIRNNSASHFTNLLSHKRFLKGRYRISLYFSNTYKVDFSRTLLKRKLLKNLIAFLYANRMYLNLLSFWKFPLMILNVVLSQFIDNIYCSNLNNKSDKNVLKNRLNLFLVTLFYLLFKTVKRFKYFYNNLQNKLISKV